MIRHDLAKPQQPVVRVEREKVGEQAFTIDWGKFPDKSRRATGSWQQPIGCLDQLVGAVSGLVHVGFSFSSGGMMRRKTNSIGSASRSLGKTRISVGGHVLVRLSP